jgi:Cu-processing system ATP-binding protein
MIQITDLHKSFGKLEVLRGIHLDLERPGITAILGPNGSGKTTLIKSLLGMVIPTRGVIRFEGTDIRGQWDYRRRIDYLPQIARFPDNLRVRELLDMIRDIRGTEPRAMKALIARFEMEVYMDKRFSNLSGGTRQKANLIQAFMYDSPVVILDEPTNGLDPVALLRLKELLAEEKAKGKMILITTHIMSFVDEMADDVVFLLDGNIHYRGSVPELKRTYAEENLEKAIAGILQGRKVQASQNGHTVVPVHGKTPAFKLEKL